MVAPYAGRKLIAFIMALTIGQSRITSGTHCPHGCGASFVKVLVLMAVMK
jgi:hypothetical protein